MNKIMIFAIEGFSGSGKTTLTKKIYEEMNSKYNLKIHGGFEIREDSSDISKLCKSLINKHGFFNMPVLSETVLLYAEMISELEIIHSYHRDTIVIFDNYIKSIQLIQEKISENTEFRFLVKDISSFFNNILSSFFSFEIHTIYINETFENCLNNINSRNNHAKNLNDKYLKEIYQNLKSYYLIKDNTSLLVSNVDDDFDMIINYIKDNVNENYML